MSHHLRTPSARARAGRLLRHTGALGMLLTGSLASAQGVMPGELSSQGYKLPGGFEPVLQLRTYYFDQEGLTGSQNEAWALGGWAGVRSPWWGDMAQLGLVGYTSQRLYGPLDKDGTKLLAPGQQPITVLGEAWGALRFFGQTFTAYRQLINRPFINPNDSRMVPNTFEAYTLTGSADTLAYTGGYITKVKVRDSESFKWMSNSAGGSGSNEGVIYGGATWNFAKNAYLKVDEQYGVDVFNTFYVEGKVPIAINDKTSMTLGAQYYPQSAVGAKQIGAFSTYGSGLQAALDLGPLDFQLSYTQTGKGYATQNPYGVHASYLSVQISDFNSAGEQAWGLRAAYDFANLGAPGLTASALFNAGSQRIDAATGSPIPDHKETDLRADYAFGKGTSLQGLVATLRYAWLSQDGSPQTQQQLRAILNYPFSF